ncbi:hypothetical protein [Micromonospora oryzae]|uniref:hypothetical protein n=1 Tax=Micromonospora sp. DSM 102119 TaxID=3111768 RepID=UPI0031DE546F
MNAVPQDVPARRDWRDVLRDAADLALVGFALVVGALPVVTAGAALATASAAVHDRITDGGWPDARTTLRRYVRGLPAGVPVTLAALAGAVLLGADLAALATGRVPGGAPALLVTGVVTAALAGYAGLVVVEVGRAGGRGWRAAARSAARACLARPGGWAAASGVCCVAGVLTALVIPVALPILAGYALAALHAVARRPAVAVEPS